MPTKEQIKQKEQEIIDLARKLCKEKISEEYADLSEKLIRKLGRKREVPFILGNSEIWATAVIHALGSINFLFDKTFLPYISARDLSDFFSLNQNTVSSKASQIMKMLKLAAFDEDFSTEYMLKNNPFNQIRMSEEGFLFFDQDEFDEDDFDEDGPFLDKIAIFIRPKQAFIDWLNKFEPINPFIKNDFLDGTTYLVLEEIDDFGDENEIDRFVERRYLEISSNEFGDYWTDEKAWPKNFTFKDFKQWFEYHVSSMIIDLDEEES